MCQEKLFVSYRTYSKIWDTLWCFIWLGIPNVDDVYLTRFCCFLTDTRETAFLHAISSAGVLHQVTQSCSLGHLPKCYCDRHFRGKSFPLFFQCFLLAFYFGANDTPDFGVGCLFWSAGINVMHVPCDTPLVLYLQTSLTANWLTVQFLIYNWEQIQGCQELD